MSEEVFQAKENLMKSIRTFLEKFNRYPFGVMPKILSQAWEKFFEIQHSQPDDTNKLFQELLEDLQIITFTTFSNPLFDCNDDFTSTDDESLPEEDVPIEEFKVYLNPLFDDEEINSDKLDLHCFNAESDLIESLLSRDTLIDSSPKFYFLLKEFSGELAHINLILPGIKEADFDLEEEIR
nr:hypothetical protein [Tanacetum cinerariifolium]